MYKDIEVLRVGVVGARKRNTSLDKNLIKKVLLYRINKGDQIMLVSGGCRQGADKFAEELSEELKLDIAIYYPDVTLNMQKWEYAQACYDRNGRIAQNCDILIALPGFDEWGKPIGGTSDTINKCIALMKPVIIL